MILITGGAGVMGRRLVTALKARDKPIRVLCLPGEAPALAQAKVDVVYGDITRPQDLSGLLEGVETVMHLAAVILSPARPEVFQKVNLAGTRNLVKLSEKAGVRHFIYISSASVTYPKSNPYSQSKQGAEAVIKHSDIPHTIVRPTLAYEEGGAEEFMKFVQYLKSFPIIPFIGKGDALKAPVFVQDIIEGLVRIPDNPLTFGKVYNLSGGEVLSIRDMAQRLLRHMGKQKPIVAVPVPLCRSMAALFTLAGKIPGFQSQFTWQTISGITQDANLDNTQAKKDLHYNPRSFSEGIKELKNLKDCLL